MIKPKIGLEEFSKILEPVLLEYYDTGITEEVVVSINVQRARYCFDHCSRIYTFLDFFIISLYGI